MDEQRAWIRSRRKRRLRLTAAILAVCLLVTTYPNILETIYVFAAGLRGDGGAMSITGFVELPEETAQQTVPVGTDISELELPDTLEAYVTVEDKNDTEDDRKPDDGDQDKDDDEDDSDSGQDKGDKENPDEDGDDENDGDTENTGEDDGNGDDTENTDEGDGYETGEGEGENVSEGNSGDSNGNGADDNGGDDNGTNTQSTDTDVSTDTDSAANTKSSAFGIQTGSFVMPVYMSGNTQDSLTVETLTDNADTTGATNTTDAQTDGTTDAQEKRVTIGNITWESSPAYDGDVEGVYIFTPVLPEDCALSDDVSLPEITVTVMADDAHAEELRALMELLCALPDPEEYLTYDEAEDLITEHEEIIDEAQLEEAREAADDYLDKYPDEAPGSGAGIGDANEAPGSSEGTDSADAQPDSLASLLTRLKGLEHIRDTKKDCMDLECPYHYPWFVQERIAQNEVPELLTLEDLIENYDVEAPQIPVAQTYDDSACMAMARVMSAAYAVPKLHPKTLMVTTDNENNAHTGTSDGDLDIMIWSGKVWQVGYTDWFKECPNHPIEVSFTLDELPTQSAYLAVKAYDVDADEHNYVYLNDDIYKPMDLNDENGMAAYNDSTIGHLAGRHSIWSTTILEIPLEKLVKGKNVVSVYAGYWMTQVDWMQLILDGGDGGAADSNIEEFSLQLRDVTIDKRKTATIHFDATVRQQGNTEYATEYELTQISTGNAVDKYFGRTSTTETVGLTMTNYYPTGIYKITGILKDPSTEKAKAVDSIMFSYTKGVGIGTKVSHTLTPDTFTNQAVTIRVSAEKMEGVTNVTDVKVAPKEMTVTENGTYDFEVICKTEEGDEYSYLYSVTVDNIDKEPPFIAYSAITVTESQTQEEMAKLFAEALTVTDNVTKECTVSYTLPKIADVLGNGGGQVRVTAQDELGNKATQDCVLMVKSPLSFSVPTAARRGTTQTFTLTAKLTATGGKVITESGFVWGIMANPTLSFNQGSAKSSVTKGNVNFSVTTTAIVEGLTYYARAYAKTGNVCYYSDPVSFNIGAKQYGTFTIKNNNNNTFTVTRTGGSEGAQTVYYRTVNGSAVGGTHFTHKASTLTFSAGVTSKTITITEAGTTKTYNGRTATAYSNADRTYQVELYRVTGGGTLGSTTTATRTMAKNSSYTINRSIYEPYSTNAKTGATWGERGSCHQYEIADGGNKETNGRDNGINFYNGRTNLSGHKKDPFKLPWFYQGMPTVTANELAYFKDSIGASDGWGYRYEMTVTELEEAWAHLWVGYGQAPPGGQTVSSGKGASPLNVGNQKWAGYFDTGNFDGHGTVLVPGTTGDGLSGCNENGTIYTAGGKRYIVFGTEETAYMHFAACGNKQDGYRINSITDYRILIDTKEPQLLGVAPMAGGAYKKGDPITISLVFDEIVDSQNSTASGLKSLVAKTNWGDFTYAGGADTNVLYFKGTVPAGATGTISVSSITNAAKIKDLCNNTGGTASAGTGSAIVTVDTKTPTVSITNTSLASGTASGKITATNFDTLQYTWSQSTAIPVTGWFTCKSGDTASTRQAYGKWYLHALATYNTTGATAHTCQLFDFGTQENPASPMPELAVTTDNSKWTNGNRTINITRQPSGATVKVTKPDQTTTTLGSSAATYAAQTNGLYTFTLTSGSETVVRDIIVERIDKVSPTVTLTEAGSTDAVYHTLNMTAEAADDASGVGKVQYVFTTAGSAPGSGWKTAGTGNQLSDGRYSFQYTATQTVQTQIYLYVKVTDNAGNVTTVQSAAYTVIKEPAESEKPAVTLTAASDGWTTDDVTLTWSLTNGGAGNCAVYVNNGWLGGQTTGSTGTFKAENNGIYMASVMDDNGDLASATALVNNIDRDAPKVDKLTVLPTGYAPEKTVTMAGITDNVTALYGEKGVTGHSGSGIAKQEYQMTGDSGWTTLTGDSVNVNKNGTYTVRLTDNLGNVGEYSVEVTGIDATAPTVTCTVNATPNAKSGWYTAATVPVVLTFADETGEEGEAGGIQSVQYKLVTDKETTPDSGLSSVEASAISSGTYTYDIRSNYNGEYYLYYKVTDKAGNITDGFSDLIRKDSVGSGKITGPEQGQPLSAGLAMHMELTYGPAGGYLTAGTAASDEKIADLAAYPEKGSKTQVADYIAKNTGTNYFRYYRYAVNGDTGRSSIIWSFYVRRIDFNTMGGSDVESQLVWDQNDTTVYCTAVKPEDPTRIGYTFGGWYTDAACTEGNEFDFNTQVRANTTLYARWTANNYKVIYHLTNSDGNGYMPDAAVQTYTYGQGLTLPVPASVKEGFTFYGWYDNAGYTGTAYTLIAKTATGDKEYYAYFEDTQAPQITGTELANVTNENAEDGWYRSGSDSGSAAIAVTGCSDNAAVTSVSVRVDDQPYTETGVYMASAGTYQYALQEGEHNYTFKLADAAGNETVSEKKTVKYDGTKPVIGEIKYEKKVSGFLDWIIGKESLIIHIPVTDSLSGVTKLTYTETTITGTEETTEEKTVSLSGKPEEQTVDLKLDADWKGKISDIVCTDRAGNVSDSKTVGTSGNIIVEDNAPRIDITVADMTDASNPRPGNAVSGDYYEENNAPTLYVSVQDEGAEDMGISAGIEKITYAINGEEREVSGGFADTLTDSYGFIVPLNDYTGVVIVTVKAVDHAGNTATENVTVKIEGDEKKPNAKPDYPKDALGSLSPNSVYVLTVPTEGGSPAEYTTDEKGYIPFILQDGADLCGKEITIIKKGDGTNTKDSLAQTLTITARPPAPTGTVTPELAVGMDDAVINITIDEAGTKEYSTDSGASWSDVPDDDIIKDLPPGNVSIRMKATETAPHGEKGTINVDPSSNKIKVVFALNYAGAGAVPEQTGLSGKDALTKPTDPTRNGFDFTGWYKSAECEKPDKWRFVDTEDGEQNLVRDIVDKTKDNYKANYTVTDGMITVTLYAGWRDSMKPELNAVLTDGSEEKGDQTKWYPNLCVALTYSDNMAVTNLYVKKDEGEYEELSIAGNSADGSGGDGYAQYRFKFDGVEEGEHTYTFKAVDAAGNEKETRDVKAKLDTKKPELGEASFNEGCKNFWDWIIRKKSLIITIPVSEAGSGIDIVKYELIPTDGGTGEASGVIKGNAKVEKTSGSDGSENSDYTATINIARNFKGKVQIVANDKAGNASAAKIIGADGNGIAGVIVENNAPEITILADREAGDMAATQPGGTALSNVPYDTPPKLIVKVEDEDISGQQAVTAGLSSITWKIGSGAWNQVNAGLESGIKTSHSFVINELEGQTGKVTVMVKAVDQADNETEKSVTVQIKEREPVPKPVIDYTNEKLTGLTPGATYVVDEENISADKQGCIDIREEWFGGSIQIRTKGKEGKTSDSKDAHVVLAARPEAPDVAKKSDETIKGKNDGVLARADTTMEYSADGGKTWTAVKTDDMVNGDLTGVASGRLRIRVRATTTAPCGEHTEIEIREGRTLTVTFETNGGSSLAPITGKSWNDTLARPETPVKEGYALVGWYRESNLAEENIWHFALDPDGADLLTDDITLYAKWNDSAKPNLSAVLADNKSAGNWYQELAFTITYSDNIATEKLYVKCDNGAYEELNISDSAESGKDLGGNTRYQIVYNDLTEGEHIYTFKAVDAAGNEAETEVLTAKLDTTKPVLGEAAFEKGYKNIWNWIIRKDSLLVTIPVKEKGSGVVSDTVEYTLIPASDDSDNGSDEDLDSITGKADVKKMSGSDGSGDADYTVEIRVASDFKGKVRILAEDRAGNPADSKTIGADGNGIAGVIVEDNAPEITILADRFVLDMEATQMGGVEISENYYVTAPNLLVTAKDDTADGAVINTGLAALSWKIDEGKEQKVNEDYDSAMVSDSSFEIEALAGKSGRHTVTVTAVDQAGNIAKETVIVKIQGKEEIPAPTINYENETLGGLKPSTEYVINLQPITTDGNGEIPVEENWLETTISIYQRGDGIATTDSDAAQKAIPGRMDTPDATIDYRQEKLTGLEANAQYVMDGTVMSADTSGSLVIEEEHMNGEKHEIAREWTGGRFRSKPQALVIPTRPAAPEGVTGVNASRKGATDGKLKGIDDTMEYREESSDENTEQWIEITSEQVEMHADNKNTEGDEEEEDDDEVGEQILGGLATGKYLVRYQATDYAFASDSAQIKITWKKAHSNPGDEEKDSNGGDENPATDDNPPTDGNPPADGNPATDGNPPTDDNPPTGDNSPTDGNPATGGNSATDGNPPTGSNPPGGEEIQVVPVIIEGGKIIISGDHGAIAESGPVMTGSVNGMTAVSTILRIYNGNGSAAGAIIVTVVCEEQAYTAGVADTVAVANAALTPEQIQFINDGEIIEIRIDVKDISGSVPEQDQEIIESGMEAYQKELPGLKLGMYIDISMFIRVGAGDWNAVTSTEEPFDIIIGLPEELQEDDREFYIIRSHEGEYTLLNDMDSASETVTISTDLFSAYAIAYQQTDTDEADGNTKCGLCHICPTFLGICCFIWLAIIAAVIIAVVIVIRRRKKETEKT